MYTGERERHKLRTGIFLSKSFQRNDNLTVTVFWRHYYILGNENCCNVFSPKRLSLMMTKGKNK